MAIQVQQVRKVYRGGWRNRALVALNNVDLEVPRGCIFGLLGPNGAGKTTLVKILLGCTRPTSGEAFLLGRPVGEPRSRLRVGYLPENPRFPSYQTAEQLLDYVGALHLVPKAERRTRGRALLEELGLGEWQKAKLHKFSKGMLQRLGLAQALLHQPEVLVLDEPTDGLDPLGRRQVRDLLAGCRARGQTVLLNSHLLSEVESICDRAAILNRGQLVAQDEMARLTARGGYELHVAGLAENSSAALEAQAMKVVIENGNHVFHFPDRAALNAALDLARSAGGQVERVQPLRATLEDAFLQTVLPEGGPPPGVPGGTTGYAD